MNAANAKWFPLYQPQAIAAAGAVTTTEIDTLGYNYLELALLLGATDGILTTCKLSESDTTAAGTGGTDITGLIFGTSTNSAGSVSTAPSATDDNKVFLFNVDLKGRKRFLYLQVVVGASSNGAYLAAVARLSRASTAPSIAAGYNASQVLQSPAYGS